MIIILGCMHHAYKSLNLANHISWKFGVFDLNLERKHSMILFLHIAIYLMKWRNNMRIKSFHVIKLNMCQDHNPSSQIIDPKYQTKNQHGVTHLGHISKLPMNKSNKALIPNEAPAWAIVCGQLDGSQTDSSCWDCIIRPSVHLVRGVKQLNWRPARVNSAPWCGQRVNRGPLSWR